MGVEESRLTVTARLNDQESIKNLVAGGLGVSIISEKAAEDARDAGRLMTFELPDGGARRELYAASRRRAGKPADPSVSGFRHRLLQVKARRKQKPGIPAEKAISLLQKGKNGDTIPLEQGRCRGSRSDAAFPKHTG